MTPLFIDNHLLVLDKPGGLLTQPSGTDDDNLEDQAKFFVKQQFGKPGNVFLEAVHRIDKPACGIVMFARTSKALARENLAMRQKKCTKIYRTVIHGILTEDAGTLVDWLIHDDFHAQVVPPNTPGAKPCSLQFKTIRRLDGKRSLLEINLETGRYHQIRAQLAARGCPIQGDVKYGAPNAYKNGAIALQHFQLSIPHPITAENMTFQSAIQLLNMFK